MKVLIASGIFPPDIGGPATYARKLASELARSGHEPLIVTYANAALPIRKENGYAVISVSRRPVLPLRYASYFASIWIHIRDVDGIYLLDSVGAGLPATLAAAWTRTPVVVRNVADFAWELGQLRGRQETFEAFQSIRPGPLLSLVRATQIWVLRRARQVVVPSDYLRRTILDWGVEPTPVHVIPNAAPPPSASSEDRETIRRDLDTKGYVLLAIGRLIPLKRLGNLIEMMPFLSEAVPETELIIIGSGPEEDKLKRLVHDLHLENQVRLVGALEQPSPYYRAADLLVLPSEHEGFPHVVLEAMQEGLVPVAFRVGGNPEIIEDGRSGVLVPWGDFAEFRSAVVTLLLSPEKRKEMAAGARRRAEDYSWEHIYKRTVDLLEDSFTKSRHPRSRHEVG